MCFVLETLPCHVKVELELFEVAPKAVCVPEVERQQNSGGRMFILPRLPGGGGSR